MLKAVEQAKVRWPKRGTEFNNYLRGIIKAHLPLSSETDAADVEELYDQRRKDHLSHFVLRLAYCKRCVLSHPPACR